MIMLSAPVLMCRNRYVSSCGLPARLIGFLDQYGNVVFPAIHVVIVFGYKCLPPTFYNDGVPRVTLDREVAAVLGVRQSHRNRTEYGAIDAPSSAV